MRVPSIFPAWVVGTISLLLLHALSAHADSISPERARELVQQQRILPLEQLLEQHQEQLRGRLIDLELEREEGQLVYELKLIDDQGRVREFMIDASTGDWLGEER